MSQADPLSRASIDAHQRWIKRGRSGPGRIDLKGAILNGSKVRTRRIYGIRMVDCHLTDAQFLQAGFEEGELIRCRFTGGDLETRVR